jgi:molybdopterin converting factor small subunit
VHDRPPWISVFNETANGLICAPGWAYTGYELPAPLSAGSPSISYRCFGDIKADAVNIIVRSYHELKPYTEHLSDQGRLELADGETVAGVLRKLRIPSKQTTNLVLFINGRAARPETRLTDGDTLVFFSSIAGG